MTNYPGLPSRQPYLPPDGAPGELWNQRDFIDRNLFRIGQVNPKYEEQWRMQHGRHLAGVPGFDDSGQVDKQAGFVNDLEREDDVYGSGIFDPVGRASTIHRDMGVFADHPSLPGYVGREQQFSVSRDLVDIANGADVVVVPGGGMSYREVGGRTVSFDRPGGTGLPAPSFRLPAPTGRDQPYAQLVPGAVDTAQRLARIEAQQRTPTSAAARGALQTGQFAVAAKLVAQAEQQLRGKPVVVDVPADRSERPVPYAHPQAQIARRDISRATTPAIPIVAKAAAMLPISGFGAAEASAPSWGTYAFVGIAIGAAAAMLVGATKIKTGR